MNESSKRLVDIMELVKCGEISISDAEILFKEWHLQFNGGASKSFKDHQVQLDRVRAELSKAKANGVTTIIPTTFTTGTSVGRADILNPATLRNGASSGLRRSSSGSRESAASPEYRPSALYDADYATMRQAAVPSIPPKRRDK